MDLWPVRLVVRFRWRRAFVNGRAAAGKQYNIGEVKNTGFHLVIVKRCVDKFKKAYGVLKKFRLYVQYH
jgi:hypothetical protein